MADDVNANKAEEYRVLAMGFRLSPVDGPAEADKDGAAEGKPAGESVGQGDPAPVSLGDLGDQFATRLQLLWTYVKEIGAAAQSTSFANMAGVLALVDEIAEAAKGRDPKDAIASFEFFVKLKESEGREQAKELKLKAPLFEHRHARAIRERSKYHDAALRILHETAVQQLVNAYEQLLADLLRRHIATNTAEAAKDQTITYQQLLDFQSLSEAKRHVIETQVTDFVRSNDTAQQFKYFRDHLKIDVGASYPELRHYRELVLRRHAIVHAGGIATPDYIRKLKSVGGFELPAEGTQLELSPGYVVSAWDVVYALGVVTFHLLAKATARRDHDAEAEDDADQWLNTCAFWAISQKRYAAAEKILSYANATRLVKNSCELMVLINLAQTYKWQGQEQKCRELLGKHDWGATNSAFQLAAGVLSGEDIAVLMTRAVKDGQLSLDNVYEWPLFQEVRRRPDFGTLLESVFGAGTIRPIEPFPATLLDLSPKARLDKIFEHLQQTAIAAGAAAELVSSAADDESTVH